MNYFNMDKIENKNNIYIKFMLCNLGEKNCLAYTKTQIYNGGSDETRCDKV